MKMFLPPYVCKMLCARRPACRWKSISLFNSYHPELYYMRGPGPKWREKHGYTAANEVRHLRAESDAPAHSYP